MKTTMILLTIAAGTMFAQPTVVAPVVAAPVKKVAPIEKRKQVQQKRIANGVANGSLTAKETAKLETKETKLNHKVAVQRAANGGTLTPKQKVAATRKQNAISNSITKEKHDAQVQK